MYLIKTSYFPFQDMYYTGTGWVAGNSIYTPIKLSYRKALKVLTILKDKEPHRKIELEEIR